MLSKRFHSSTKFRALVWLLYFMFWTFIGLISSIQNYIVENEKGQDFGWLKIISFNLPFWWFWLATTPLILWFAKKFPFRRSYYTFPILFHFCSSVIFVVLHELLQSIWCNYIFGSYYYLPVFKKLAWRLLNLEWGFVDWIVYWTILGASYALEYYRRLQERELRNSQLQTQVINAKLHALKMQIHPHFLFNTLNALSTIVKQGKKKKADAMIAQFGGFLRMTLEEGDKDEIPLGKEIEYIRHYLEIEKIRFQDKLVLNFDIQPSTLIAFVPALILQPIVENAVRYAIAPRESPGTITVRSRRENNSLYLEVEDDGAGKSFSKMKQSSCGIGLKNVQQRLETLYGNAQEYSFQHVRTGGCLVRIIMPYKEAVISFSPEYSEN